MTVAAIALFLVTGGDKIIGSILFGSAFFVALRIGRMINKR